MPITRTLRGSSGVLGVSSSHPQSVENRQSFDLPGAYPCRRCSKPDDGGSQDPEGVDFWRDYAVHDETWSPGEQRYRVHVFLGEFANSDPVK